MLLLTITLHDTTKCYDFSLWQCFTGIYVYAYLTVQSSLVSEGRLKPTLHFRYCGTIKDLTLERSLCSQNGLLSPVDRFIGLGVFCLSSLTAKDLDASHHCTCTKMLPWLFFFVLLRCIFHFVRGPVLSTADPAFYLSYLIFILSDIWSLLSLVKKKRKKKELIERKEIKQLWFLKCTVDSVFSLCHIKIMHQILVSAEMTGKWF